MNFLAFYFIFLSGAISWKTGLSGFAIRSLPALPSTQAPLHAGLVRHLKTKKQIEKKINLLSCSFIFFSQILNYSPVTTVVLKTKSPRILVIFSSQVATFVILPFLAAFAILASHQKIRPSNVPPEDFPSFSVIVAAPADTGITVEHPVYASAIAKAIIPKNFFIYFSHKRLKKIISKKNLETYLT